MANLTWLPVDCTAQSLIAFDTGPGNCLIDSAMSELRNLPYDSGGEFAALGSPNEDLLNELLNDAWFAIPPPKSTGREKFGDELARTLVADWREHGIADTDIVATLTAFTARTIAHGIGRFAAKEERVHEVLASGGGVHNHTLMDMLRAELPGVWILPIDELGIPSDAKEAFCFAILTHATLEGRPNNVPSVTGASRAVVGGSIRYPGKPSQS